MLRLRLHLRDNGRAVDPARQERAEGTSASMRRPTASRSRVSSWSTASSSPVESGSAPPAASASATVQYANRLGQPAQPGELLEADLQASARGELGDAAVDRPRCRHVPVTEIRSQRGPVDLSREPGRRPQRLQLRREHQRVAADPVVERLFTQRVAGEVQDTFLAVPQGKREHAVGPAQGLGRPEACGELEQHLGVGPTADDDTRALDVGPQRVMVVDLAVEHEHEAAVGRHHRLGAGRREVDDREAPEPERDTRFGFDPHSGVVRTTMEERRRHPGGDLRQLTRGTRGPEVDQTGDSAHGMQILGRPRTCVGRPASRARRADSLAVCRKTCDPRSR